jgi:hypothetical protein
MREIFASLAFIAFGFLAYRSADWFARFFADWADKWERDGVIRFGGGPYGKVWRDHNPKMFAFRVKNARFSATFSRLFLKFFGAICVIVATVQILAQVFR